MIAVFAAWASPSRSPLLDATVIRMAIGPALLRLAGRWNWWPDR